MHTFQTFWRQNHQFWSGQKQECMCPPTPHPACILTCIIYNCGWWNKQISQIPANGIPSFSRPRFPFCQNTQHLRHPKIPKILKGNNIVHSTQKWHKPKRRDHQIYTIYTEYREQEQSLFTANKTLPSLYINDDINLKCSPNSTGRYVHSNTKNHQIPKTRTLKRMK